VMWLDARKPSPVDERVGLLSCCSPNRGDRRASLVGFALRSSTRFWMIRDGAPASQALRASKMPRTIAR
jgi:hypothetical protein